jgi:hypothetical protein
MAMQQKSERVSPKWVGGYRRNRQLQKQINLLKNSPMMSWQHVNLHGKYDFDIEVNTSPFDLKAAKSLSIK